MKIRLTANAGVLIELDGVRILLDGVCEPTSFYLGTPPEIREELTSSFPDAVGFTHTHSDHYDGDYETLYKLSTLRLTVGSECSHLRVGEVEITAVSTRHLGRSRVLHKSFIIEGSRCIFFMGDASPSELGAMLKPIKTELLKGAEIPPFKAGSDYTSNLKYGKPDVLIVPFAYLNTDAAVKMTKAAGAEEILLVHMPSKENDPYELWKSVENSIKSENVRYFTKIGDSVTLQ